MIKDNNFLDKLYSEMIANSPRTCSMNVHQKWGRGGLLKQRQSKESYFLTGKCAIHLM